MEKNESPIPSCSAPLCAGAIDIACRAICETEVEDASATTPSSFSGRGVRMRKTGQGVRKTGLVHASQALSRMFVSMLLHRHTVLLLVPIFYFWGMLMMMQEGETDMQSPICGLPPPAAQSSVGSQTWGIYSVGEMLLQGVTNSTSFNFMMYPASAYMRAINGEPVL